MSDRSKTLYNKIIGIKVEMINTQKDVNLKENIIMIYQHIIKEIGLIIPSDYNLDLEYKQLVQSDRRKLSQFE